MGHIVKSPIRRIEKPAPKRREQVLTPAEFDTLIAHVKDVAFRDVLTFCWETGARVQEVRLIRSEHFKPGAGRVEIPPPEAKGKKRWRVIYLTETAEAIITRLPAPAAKRGAADRESSFEVIVKPHVLGALAKQYADPRREKYWPARSVLRNTSGRTLTAGPGR